jgi:hypothetical protein
LRRLAGRGNGFLVTQPFDFVKDFQRSQFMSGQRSGRSGRNFVFIGGQRRLQLPNDTSFRRN